MLRILFFIVVTLHGLIHFMGLVSAFQPASEQMRARAIFALSDSLAKGMGLLWLITGAVFLLAAILYLIKKEEWWIVAIPALFFSQILIILYWYDAKFGTLANLIILVVVAAAYGAWQFKSAAKHELSLLIPASAQRPAPKIIAEQHLTALPVVVQKWLRRSNIVGQPAAQVINLRQKGQMRTQPDGKWMKVKAQQWFTTHQPGLIWVARVDAGWGIYMDGRDKLQDGKGNMLIKLLSLVPVVNAQGTEIDQGTLLRYLGEMVWFPATALAPYVKWKVLDDHSAQATLTQGKTSVSGIFRFTDDGDVKSFEAKRYYTRKEGATLEDWVVTNNPDSYKELGGIRMPTRSEVCWKLKTGDFTWYQLEITDWRSKP